MARFHILMNAAGEPVWIGNAAAPGSTEVEAESVDFLATHALGADGRWVKRKAPVPPVPTEAELAAERAAQQLAAAEYRREAVRLAMEAEADPVFFEWQRGEATQADWLSAVARVRARYPKPGA
ncbi:MAG: hypothetical protein ACLGIE_09915 [Alphaproteobacteria bacterium]